MARASAACLVRHAPLGDDRGAGRRDARGSVILSVLSTTFGDRPGSSVETMPSLRTL